MLLTRCPEILHFRNLSLDGLPGTHHQCVFGLRKHGCAHFPRIKGNSLSPKWIQTALTFRKAELHVGCHLLTTEVFRRKKCGLEKYECGNQMIICDLVVNEKEFSHLSLVALKILQVAV